MSTTATNDRLLANGDEAGTGPGDRSFRPDVQGLRAVAVLLVLAFHAKAPLLTGGFLGVDVFFVISGFVITGLLLRERASTSTTSFVGFYARRARRILPVATLVVVATVVATYVEEGFLRGFDVAVDGRWASVFLANVHYAQVGNDYLGAQGTPSPLLHFWSLAVEEQFYVIFPVLFAVTAGLTVRRWRQRGIAGLLVVVVLASLAWSILETSSSPVTAFYSPLTRAWELALGGLVALAAPQLRRIPAWCAAGLSWAGLLAIGVAAVSFSSSTPWPGSAALVPVLGTALVIASGTAAPRFGAEVVLGSWVGLQLGAISFSLYLWHFPLLAIADQVEPGPLRWTTRAVLLAVSLVLAIATYRLVENPVRHSARLRDRPGVSIGIGGALIALSLVVCTAMIATHPLPGTDTRPPGPSSVGPKALHRAIAEGARAEKAPPVFVPSLSTLHGSVLRDPSIPDRCIRQLDEMSPGPLCVLGDRSAKRTMVLLGDSQAMAWSTSFLGLADDQGWRLVLIGRDGCPPWRSLSSSGASADVCRQFHRWSLEKIAAIHPDAVVVTGAPTPHSSSAQDRAGSARLIERLARISSRQLVLGPAPWFAGRWSGLGPAECIAQQPDHLTSCNIATRTLNASFGAFARAIEAGSTTTASASYVPVRGLFCTDSTCPVLAAHRVIYHDAWHLSATWGRFVVPSLEVLLAGPLGGPSR